MTTADTRSVATCSAWCRLLSLDAPTNWSWCRLICASICRERRIHVVPSGLDFSRIPLMPREDARRQLGLSLSKRLVLFVGNPAEARKRHGLAREIVSRLDQSLDAELVVAWRVPHDVIPVYMNACDALLFVSMYEGLSERRQGGAGLQPADRVGRGRRRCRTTQRRGRLHGVPE